MTLSQQTIQEFVDNAISFIVDPDTLSASKNVWDDDTLECYQTVKALPNGITYHIRKDNNPFTRNATWEWRVVRRDGRGGQTGCFAYSCTTGMCLQYDVMCEGHLFQIDGCDHPLVFTS